MFRRVVPYDRVVAEDDRGRTLLDVAATAARLGVRPETVYAYVSRGRLHPVEVPGERKSHFDPAEVDALATRARRPASTRSPVDIETAITALRADGPWYRGHPAVELSRSASFEAVAELLWTGELPSGQPCFLAPDAQREAVGGALAGLDAGAGETVRSGDRLRVAVLAATAADPWRADLSPAAVAQAGRQRLAALVFAVAPGTDPTAPIASRLASALAADAVSPALIDAALVLLADHELAGSTFATRIAASFGADVGAAISAGFGPLAGARHGAASIQAEALLADIEARGSAVAIADWLSVHSHLPGFGHVVYTDGDARAGELLTRIRGVASGSAGLAAADELIGAAADRAIPSPNVDLALAALLRVGGMSPDAGEVIFTIARTAGLVAHAAEEYTAPSRLRPRARYVGAPLGSGG